MSICDKCQALCKNNLGEYEFCIGFTDKYGNTGIEAFKRYKEE